MSIAVIFDMDGLIFDTERVFADMERRIAKEWSLDDIDEVINESYGVNHIAVKALYMRKYGENFLYENFHKTTLQYVKEYLAENGIPKKYGLYEILDYLDEIGCKKAIGTSTFGQHAIPLLKSTGIYDRFDSVITGDMVEKSKPEPDIFLKAAESINKEPVECIVLEDSFSGIKAAYNAKMIPIMIPDLRKPTQEIIPFTYAICDTLVDAIDIISEINENHI
ncbi:MAG: hypothetical protein A2Y17_10005 [Clostridiales bacterium GWF2_38_85]|nr:MAG: hypothetical protein A2Y17_10005 [Clostridiales bacterium GWF2_38_85]HBL84450.1 hypothetical protein [Clostridiales bacterium]